ncbi:hypothetical protein [Eisenibacter elegans]|jgi:hypothetical protein|uniref:hypothetical protein n=1 Tax=Eisenibacter elegans TaxID=997 RepID=UPI0004261931|nr:hypothetical protein [Eisenibacter elegans]
MSNKALFEDLIGEAIQHSTNTPDGWTNLAEVGAYLRKKGIRYGKLSLFLNDYQYMLETRMDDSVSPPAMYVRLIKTPATSQ